MKKLLRYFVGVVLAMFVFSSCTKDEDYWMVETGPIEYYEYSIYSRFVSEIDALDDGVMWTISQVEREVDSIVKKYDGDLRGIVYLKTGPSMSGPWSTKEVWTMRLR